MFNFKKNFKQLMNETNEDKLSDTLFNILSIAFVSGIVVFIFDLVLFLCGNENIGVFGDFFGGVLNPIFTFLTFFGLIFTIIIQRKELGQATLEYRKTANALTTQALENTFFNILDLHQKNVDNLSITPTLINTSRTKNFSESFVHRKEAKKQFTGRQVFTSVINIITNQVYFTTPAIIVPSEITDRYKIIQQYNNHVLGHYFRNLYQAIKLIDKQEDISYLKKKQYTGIIRAQLSTEELALLFLNCLKDTCDNGQFKDLLVRYAMLEHLPIIPSQIDSNGYHQIVGTEIYFTDESLMYYKKESNNSSPEEGWGAFGKNPNIPSHLK